MLSGRCQTLPQRSRRLQAPQGWPLGRPFHLWGRWLQPVFSVTRSAPSDASENGKPHRSLLCSLQYLPAYPPHPPPSPSAASGSRRTYLPTYLPTPPPCLPQNLPTYLGRSCVQTYVGPERTKRCGWHRVNERFWAVTAPWDHDLPHLTPPQSPIHTCLTPFESVMG